MFSSASRSIHYENRILKFLFDGLFVKYGSGTVLLILFIVPVFLCYVAGYIDGTLYNTPNLIGVVEDFTLYTLWIVVLLAVYIYYLYAKFLSDFFSNRLPLLINLETISEEEITGLDARFSRIVSPKGKYQILYGIVVIAFGSFWTINLSNSFDPVAHYGKDMWHSANHIAGFIILKFFNLLYTTILMAVFFYKFLAGLFAFSWLFKRISKKNGFLIKPLTPDNCAGLKVLSDLSLFFMYMVLPFFLVFLSIVLRGTNLLPTQQLVFFFLTILLFVTFFLPLGSVHSAMKRAKVSELDRISFHFSELNTMVNGQLKKKGYDDTLLQEIRLLEKIDFLYAKVERMPVWPFNLNNLSRLLLAAAIPVIVLFIQLITNADSILYNLDKLEIFKPFFK